MPYYMRQVFTDYTSDCEILFLFQSVAKISYIFKLSDERVTFVFGSVFVSDLIRFFCNRLILDVTWKINDFKLIY